MSKITLLIGLLLSPLLAPSPSHACGKEELSSKKKMRILLSIIAVAGVTGVVVIVVIFFLRSRKPPSGFWENPNPSNEEALRTYNEIRTISQLNKFCRVIKGKNNSAKLMKVVKEVERTEDEVLYQQKKSCGIVTGKEDYFKQKKDFFEKKRQYFINHRTDSDITEWKPVNQEKKITSLIEQAVQMG